MTDRVPKRVVVTRRDGTQYVSTVYVGSRSTGVPELSRSIGIPKPATVSISPTQPGVRSSEAEESRRLTDLSPTLSDLAESSPDIFSALTINGMMPTEIVAIRYSNTYARRALAILEVNRDTLSRSSRTKLTKAGILG